MQRVIYLLRLLAVLILASRLCSVYSNTKPVYDVLITGGRIIDGSGDAAYYADIGITGDKIAGIGRFDPMLAKDIITVHGLVVAPGFINAHSHSDQSIHSHPALLSALMQGITTEIVGNDGFSAVDIEQYLQELAGCGLPVNIATLIGHGSVRESVMGTSSSVPSESQLKHMRALVNQAMLDGALGISTGLEYMPGMYAGTEELVSLARVAASHHGIYVSHIRNEQGRTAEALEEALHIGREAGIPIHISHLKITDLSIRPAAQVRDEVITMINGERSAGRRVTADLYPYTVPWFLSNRSLCEVEKNYAYCQIYVLSADGNTAVEGKSIEQIAKEKAQTPQSVVQQLLAADPQARAYVTTISEEALVSLLQTDFTMVTTDAAAISLAEAESSAGFDMTEFVHPRAFGTNPRIFATYVREQAVLSLEEAVYKMTGLVAETFGLELRGLIREGYYADVVVFNPDTIQDRATYLQPAYFPRGIEYVFVNGHAQVKNGLPVAESGYGQVLKRKQ